MSKPLLIILVLVAVAVPVICYRATPDATDANHLVLYGNVDIREAQLTFNSSKHVDRVLFEESQLVQKGRLLSVLHQNPIRARVAQAKAQYTARELQLTKLIAGSRPQ